MKEHKDGRSLDHEALEAFRLAAVRLRQRGVPVQTIAESFGVTSEAVYLWLKKARTQGLAVQRNLVEGQDAQMPAGPPFIG
jgi:transposase-like protein